MFKTEPMRKVRILCLEKDRRGVIRILHRLGVIDLRRSKLNLQDIQPQEELNTVNELLVRVDGAISVLEKRDTHRTQNMNFSELSKKVRDNAVIDEIYTLSGRSKALEDENKLLEYADSVAMSFNGFRIDFSRLKSEALAIRGFEIQSKQLAEFAREFRSKVKNSELASVRHGKSVTLLVAYDKKVNIDEILKAHALKEFDLASKYLKGTPEKALAAVKYERTKNAAELAKIRIRLRQLSDAHYAVLVGYYEMLNIELSRVTANSYLKKTDSTFVIEGWVPKKYLERLQSTLSERISNRVVFEIIDEKEELAPTLTSRPNFFKPFDYMVEFFSVPRSDEIDPTWIFIISFPIFYGFMISDVGYGIMSFILATLIKRKVDKEGLMYNVSSLWQINAIAAIFFGVLSNQYLGMPLNQYIISNYVGLNWFTDLSFIAIVSVLFGISQVTLGLAFGFINDYNHHKKKLAFAKVSSIILVISSTIAIAGGLFGALSQSVALPAAGIAIAALVTTVALSGEKALEVIDLISHTLSYLRIMGFGLASVIIAFLIDFAFTPKLSDGILMFILYAIIFLLLHVLNMVVSIFEGLVQGLRLNFVEFFTKFYEGGGIKFRPFSYKRVYTKE